MANVKISELAVNSSPSASATLAGVDGGQTVQIPISYFQNLIEGRMPYYRVYSNTPATLLSAVTDVIWNAIGKWSGTRILLEIYGYHNALLVINAIETNGICSIKATNLYTGEQLQAKNIDPTTTTISSFLSNYVVSEKIVYHYSDINTPMVDFANYVISQGYIEGQDALAKIKDKMYIFNISASWAGGILRRYTFLDLVDLKKFYNEGSTGDMQLAQLLSEDPYASTITSVFDELTDHEGRITALEESGDDAPSYSEGLAFSLMSDGNSYGVSGIGTCTDTDIIIPSVHNGERVSGIKLQAFYNNTNITSVVIPNSVTYINKHAFNGCTSLASVVIPESVTTIGYYAFQNCTNLKIYCETSSKPSGWDAQWNASDRPVVWGATMDILGLNGKIAECVTETELDAKGYATEEYVDEKVSSMSGGTSSGSSNSIHHTYFTCYSSERTVRELIDQLANEGVNTTDSITVIVTFSAMLSGTFLCDMSHYYGDYYGFKFTDLTNLKTYYFEGESRSLSLYDNLSNGGGNSEATMPRIRLSNWKYTEPVKFVMDDVHPDGEFIGEITFSICVQDGTVQEGDELEICALRKTFGKYKLRQFSKKVITAEDIENLAKQPYLQITTTDIGPFYRTESGNNLLKKPKYIRIRRPIWGENKYGDWVEVNALFSNVVPVEIGLKYEDITQYE